MSNTSKPRYLPEGKCHTWLQVLGCHISIQRGWRKSDESHQVKCKIRPLNNKLKLRSQARHLNRECHDCNFTQILNLSILNEDMFNNQQARLQAWCNSKSKITIGDKRTRTQRRIVKVNLEGKKRNSISLRRNRRFLWSRWTGKLTKMLLINL